MTPVTSPSSSSTDIASALGPPGAPSKRLRAEQTALLDKIQCISARLFPGPVTFEHSFDPEDPANEYVVFDVLADGEFKDYVQREFQWHDEVEKLAPGALSEFRLCVHPRP